MSNLSNIGFNVTSQEGFQELLSTIYQVSLPLQTKEGIYNIYTDGSGAQMYIQFNTKNECIGANPHYVGKSKRTVCLTDAFERPESELDGAFHCWAAPSEVNNPTSGAYPFVFDSPEFKTIGTIDFPQNADIQLAGFAHELSVYSSENEFAEHQTGEVKWATQSFIPSGLFYSDEGKEPEVPQATGILTGTIKEFERKKNELTGEAFYWLLVDTLGGEIDVVADLRFFDREPQRGGVIQGVFWLSGRLLNPPIREVKPKNIFQKLFGR
jgi:hypothetical protein